MTRHYLVVYESGAGNWSGFAPDVPGCISTGATVDELRNNLADALGFHLEGLALDRLALPEPSTHVVEIPEGGAAEWLAVEQAMHEAGFRLRITRGNC